MELKLTVEKLSVILRFLRPNYHNFHYVNLLRTYTGCANLLAANPECGG